MKMEDEWTNRKWMLAVLAWPPQGHRDMREAANEFEWQNMRLARVYVCTCTAAFRDACARKAPSSWHQRISEFSHVCRILFVGNRRNTQILVDCEASYATMWWTMKLSDEDLTHLPDRWSDRNTPTLAAGGVPDHVHNVRWCLLWFTWKTNCLTKSRRWNARWQFKTSTFTCSSQVCE